ncbi:MAG: transcription-repair coupling factor [Clostridia bacterium]|nr:transcription-repair coupling factor [Clostridia bacterium]MBR3865747.1 transcription-repair coupling factor [Clostridia bacterium]
MQTLLSNVKKLQEYGSLLADITAGKKVSLYGAAPVHRAHFVSAILSDCKNPLCVITSDDAASRHFAADVEAFCGEQPAVLAARDLIFHDAEGVSRDIEQQRMGALYSFGTGMSRIMIASAEALMLRTIPKETLPKCAVILKEGESYDLSALCEIFVACGYTRCEQIEGAGQFALRGGILDIFPAGAAAPVRAEFFGDDIDLLSEFDINSQRRTEKVDKVNILPAKEVLPRLAEGGQEGFCKALLDYSNKKNINDALRTRLISDSEKASQGALFSADRWMDFVYPFATGFDHLPDGTLLVFSDTAAVRAAAESLDKRMQEEVKDLLERGALAPSKRGFNLTEGEFWSAVQNYGVAFMDSFLSSSKVTLDSILSITAKQLPACGNVETMVSDLENYTGHNYTLYALAGGETRAKSITTILDEHGFSCVSSGSQAGKGRVCVLPTALSSGFEYPSIGLAVISQTEGRKKPIRRKAKSSSKNHIQSFSDLVPGDLVVHENHGIGRFVSLERIQVEGAWRDYLKIAFDGSDVVFVPATALHLVSKYIGAGENTTVKLSKLGGMSWEKAKARAKKSAQDLAEGLIKLYAARQKIDGFPFDPDNDWQRGFEEAFEYEETEDQLLCTQEIKSDMQKPYPMDRLLCGDVGFGKTEVAFRAVMKCVLSGKQAAILAPTTVLARQHFVSACQRFGSYPIKIEMMSRFRTSAQLKATAKRVTSGECDLLIGTHRILQKDVIFKDLGLLVVDEEQRFGVTHKEKIKQMTQAVDVLTLTATPIPRTLNMALSGIKDMSVLEEAPFGRQPVQTYVLEHDDNVIYDAIRRELARGGQVYYLHNRVESIERVASRLRMAFPDENIATAHGKMDEKTISEVMNGMYSGEIAIMVCTTIIETGVDIPNVNTLIIEDADKMGLAQLHQIRGRVGRSPRRAYAYLTYKRGKVLTEISQKRLSAIREFAEFGSGFKIAMRDLEIRGAGNLLGAEQSGHMMSVGYDMYLQLLEEATVELKGEKPVRRTDCTADILVSAGLPQTYISDPGTRVDVYRRIANITDIDDFRDMQDELIDRFGDIPASAQTLLDIALLRADASRADIKEITQRDGKLYFYLRDIQPERVLGLCALPDFKVRLTINAGNKPCFVLKLKPGENSLVAAKKLVAFYSEGGKQ